MTSVYGVTYIGARDQIKRRLKERGAIMDDTEIFRASCYAAKVGVIVLFIFVQFCCFDCLWSDTCWLFVVIAKPSESKMN